MAKNKRPQRSVHTSGVPEVQIQTGISGVDTFVDPGLAGMPQQKEGTVAPNQPDMQRSRDLHALGAAFKGLVPALQNYEMSELKLDAAHRQVGEEQALIKHNLEKAGKVYADAVSDKTLDVLDHPAAAKSMSLATAELMVKDYTDTWMSNEDTFRATSEAALDINATLSMFDKGIENMARPKLARHPDFEAQLVRSQSKYRSIIESRHRKWLGDKTLEDTISALGAEVGAIVDNGALLEYEPKVTTNMWGLPTYIAPLTDEEIFELNVEGGAARLTEMLDLGQGNLLTSRMMHETMGVALIDIAKYDPDPVKSRMAEAMVLRMDTGPKNNRVKLISPGGDGRSQLDKYYRKSLKQIKSNQIINTTAQQNEEFSGGVEEHGEALIDAISQNIVNTGGAVADYDIIQEVVGGLPDGKTTDIDVNGDGKIDFTLLRNGDTLTYNNDPSVQGKGVTSSIKVSDLIKKADTRVYEQTYQAELTTSGDPSVAHAMASHRTNQVSNAITQWGTTAFQMMDYTRINGSENPESREDALDLFGKTMVAVSALKSTGNVEMFNRTFPDEHVRSFWSLAHAMYTNETLRHMGTTDTETLFDRLISQNGQGGMTVREFESKWADGGGDDLVAEFVNQYKWGQGRNISREVRLDARVLNYFGGLGLEDAIETAISLKQDTMVDFRGFWIEKEGVNAELLQNIIPVDSVSGEIPEIHVDRDFGWLQHALPGDFGLKTGYSARSVKQAVLHIPELFETAILPIWDNLKDKNTPGLFHFNNRERRGLVKTFNSWWKAMRETSQQGIRKITVNEALDAAEETIRVAPPRGFMTEEFIHSEQIVGFFPEKGTEGMAYTLISETDIGTWRDAGTYSLNQIVQLGRWGDKKAHPEAFFTVDKRRLMAVEKEAERKRREQEQDILKGSFQFSRGGFRHPLDILYGLTYGQRDYDGKTVRQMSIPKSIRDRGLTTGTIYSGATKIQQ